MEIIQKKCRSLCLIALRLFTEFPELAPKADAPERVYPKSDDIVVNQLAELESGKPSGRRIFELGSGVGNSKRFIQIKAE